MSASDKSAGRRLSTITVDQVISGCASLLISVAAARVLGVASFGLFGIVFIVYVTAQGMSRALIGDPLLVHPVEAEERPGDVIGSARLLGLAIGAVVCLSGLLAWMWDDRLAGALLVLGVCMPGLVLQDLGRYLGFVLHRPVRALVLDVSWVCLMTVAIAAIVVSGTTSLIWFVVAWAGSGAVVGSLMPWRYRRHPMKHSAVWLRETWGFSWRYLISFGATQGAALGTAIGIMAISGARTLGAVRGALLLVRPSSTLQSAAIAAGIAEVSRMPPGSDAVRRNVSRTTVITTIVALLNLVVLVMLPDEIGRQILGDTWAPTEPLLLPASVQIVLLALVSGPRAAMLGQRAIRVAVRIDVVSTAMLVVATLVGAVVNDALGAFWACVVAQAVIAVIWWVAYVRRTSDPVAPADAEDEPGDVPSSPPSLS